MTAELEHIRTLNAQMEEQIRQNEIATAVDINRIYELQEAITKLTADDADTRTRKVKE